MLSNGICSSATTKTPPRFSGLSSCRPKSVQQVRPLLHQLHPLGEYGVTVIQIIIRSTSSRVISSPPRRIAWRSLRQRKPQQHVVERAAEIDGALFGAVTFIKANDGELVFTCNQFGSVSLGGPGFRAWHRADVSALRASIPSRGRLCQAAKIKRHFIGPVGEQVICAAFDERAVPLKRAIYLVAVNFERHAGNPA